MIWVPRKKQKSIAESARPLKMPLVEATNCSKTEVSQTSL